MMRFILVLSIFFLVACEKKSDPTTIIDSHLTTPIQCMALNTIGIEKPFVNKLQVLYTFDNRCDLKLTMKYKKDIVCNSPYNPNMKNVAQFPKSFLHLELRKGFKVLYSYYIDLYSNVDEEDIESAFLMLKKALIEKKTNASTFNIKG